MATQARAVLKIPARIVGTGNISVTLQNGIYSIGSTQSGGMNVNSQTGNTYTLVASDNGKLVTFNSTGQVTVTVPAGLGIGFACEVAQLGAGTVLFVEDGTTVNALGGVTSLTGQYSLGWLRAYAPNAFILSPSSEVLPSEVLERTTAFAGSGGMVTTSPVGLATPTSAGVFDSTGKLVRVLWSAEVGNPYRNDPVSAWDGTIEDGSVASSGTYTVKRISHAVSYVWDGAIGNTSPDHTTATYHAYGSVVRGMAITDGGEIYFSTAYDERIQTFRVMTTADIQNSTSAVPPQTFRSALSSTGAVCTDGTITYLALTETGSSAGVIGTNCTTKVKVAFSSGTTVGTLTFLGLNTNPSFEGHVQGLAVQKTGSYIFLARPNLGAVQVYNKTTAAFVSTFTGLAHPRCVASNPAAITQLWVANDTTGDGLAEVVVKCAVDGAGTITTTATTIAVGNALALAISPDGSTLLVADGASHQVKAYNTSDGSVRSGWGTSGTLGVSGGYVNSPAVTNTKFMFYAIVDMGSVGPMSFLAYQADGKFWVGDVGNSRYLRFSSGEAPAYIDQFSYIPGFYPCRVCKNDPTRVFAHFLEFTIDYDLALSPTNGSWVLANNWAGNLISHPNAPLTTALYNALKWVGTYSNGRTYGLVDLIGFGTRNWFELTSTGLRDTVTAIIPQNYVDDNMDAYYTSNATEGGVCTIVKNAFTGFDGSGNPTWTIMNDTGAIDHRPTADFGTEVVFTSETLPAGFVRTHGYDNNMQVPMEATANGTIPFFDPDTGVAGVGYGATHNHFGGINATTGLVKFNTGPLTPTLNGGIGLYFLFYPPAPYAPYNVGLGGGPVLYVPGHEHIFVVFNGEEWGNNQTNVITHWHESGLALSTFGPAAPYFGAWSLRRPDLLEGDDIPGADPYSFLGLLGMAGNSRWGGIAFVGGKYYIYQNDEWYHGGIGRWRVENLESVSITDVSVTWDSTSYTPVTDPTDMLEGLTPNSVLVDGDSGWHRSGAEAGSNFHLFTNGISCDRRKPDIAMQGRFLSDDVMRYAARDLIRAGSGNWTLEGDIFMFPGVASDTNPFVGGLILFDILDDTGKIILRWYSYVDFDGAGGTAIVNDDELFPIPAGWTTADYPKTYFGAVRPFSIAANISTGIITFTYDIHTMEVPAVFEVGADITAPTTFRLGYDADAGEGEPATCITRLRFE